jgi:acyl-CoA synthetase (NDP forming)
MNSHQ